MALVPFSSEIQATTLTVSGYLDERAHFPDVSSIDAVNMQAITGFSSLGLKHFLQFLYDQATTSVQLLECPVSFIESVNAISGLLKGRKLSIASLMLPCYCDLCSIEIEVLVRSSDVALDGSDITLPPLRCHRCREQLRLLVDPLEYFLFLYN